MIPFGNNKRWAHGWPPCDEGFAAQSQKPDSCARSLWSRFFFFFLDAYTTSDLRTFHRTCVHVRKECSLEISVKICLRTCMYYMREGPGFDHCPRKVLNLDVVSRNRRANKPRQTRHCGFRVFVGKTRKPQCLYMFCLWFMYCTHILAFPIPTSLIRSKIWLPESLCPYQHNLIQRFALLLSLTQTRVTPYRAQTWKAP